MKDILSNVEDFEEENGKNDETKEWLVRLRVS